MTPHHLHGRDAAISPWKRFNDECFSLHARLPSVPDALVSGLAAAGVELILDARPSHGADAGAIASGCESAGIYYVPADDRGAYADVSDQAVKRYAKLALRHKTCVVVDDSAENLLRLIGNQLPGHIVPLDENVDGLM